MNRKDEQKTILVADDDESICKMMHDMIARRYPDILVELCFSGEDAVETSISRDYDIIFMDLNFEEGKMGGMEALKRIKEIKRDQKVCVMTGYYVQDEMEAKITIDALCILHKPFTLESLFEIITKNVAEQHLT